MKFINYLKSIDGVKVFPMFSLIVFFVFFVLLLMYVFKSDKNRLKNYSKIPLDN